MPKKINKFTFFIVCITLSTTIALGMKSSENHKNLIIRINLIDLTNKMLDESLEKVKKQTFDSTKDAFDVRIKCFQESIQTIMNEAAQKWAHNLLEIEQSFNLIINFFQQQPEGPLKQNLCKEIEQIEIEINDQTQEEIDG